MLVIILFVLSGCREGEQSTDGIITVDVTARYPKKELILQDFMDVEYIPLETTDEFVCQSFVRDIGKDIIIITNRNDDGDIFFFDRNTGKGLEKINRKGQGGEEYTYAMGIVLDEENEEIFVNDPYAKKILVYDYDGNFKRRFEHRDSIVFYSKVYNFDREHLICYDGEYDGSNERPYAIVSKQDGSVIKEVQIPFKEKKFGHVSRKDGSSDMVYTVKTHGHHPIIPYFENWILVEPSSDTVFYYSNEYDKTPFIVRTPSVQSMDPEVFLFLNIFTDRYYFMETIKKEFDFDSNEGFPRKNLMYDKQKNSIFEYLVFNGDFSIKKQVYMNMGPISCEIVACLVLEASDLLWSDEIGELKGRLKELAATLDEDSNAVLMLVKHK